MKIVMYHYVRPGTPDLPHFPYLHLDDFRRQLDWMAENGDLIDQETFHGALKRKEAPQDAFVLSFDDGLRDHTDYVLPELTVRGLWALFYIPTGIFASQRMLDVHRIHVLLGRLGGVAALARLQAHLRVDGISVQDADIVPVDTYANQSADQATKGFKSTLNYRMTPTQRRQLLDEMMAETFDEPALLHRFYIDDSGICNLQAQGMAIGSHGETHSVMSALSIVTQAAEIGRSFELLETVAGVLPFRSFCYPFGHPSTFSEDTEHLLSQAGCAFSVQLENRAVTNRDLRDRPQALPRVDCNLLPHGDASWGPGTEAAGA